MKRIGQRLEWDWRSELGFNKTLDELSTDDFKFHPKIMELRLALLYTEARNILGLESANGLLFSLCEVTGNNKDIIMNNIGVASNRIMAMGYYDKDYHNASIVLMLASWYNNKTHVKKILFLNGRKYKVQKLSEYEAKEIILSRYADNLYFITSSEIYYEVKDFLTKLERIREVL